MEDDNNTASKLIEIKEKKTKRIIEKIEGLATYVTIPRELAIYNVNIDSQEAKLLIDYITNLQEKVKPYETGYINGVHDERERNKAEIINLQQENENNKRTINLFNDDLKNMIYQLAKEKSRIEKAVEYIKINCIASDKWEDLGFCNFVPIGKITYKQLSKNKISKLLNILNGRSDE